MFNSLSVASITKQFDEMLQKLEKVEVRSLQRISDSQAVIRAANEYIDEQNSELSAARRVSANIRNLIGE